MAFTYVLNLINYIKKIKIQTFNPKINNKKFNEIGKYIFHAKYINLSYRNRGKVPRTQINKNDKNPNFKKNNHKIKSPPKNKITLNILINKILAYSAKKIIANPPLLYSTLNPETNSDSPSAKSKGVRFVSAKLDTNHIKLKGNKKKINQIYS